MVGALAVGWRNYLDGLEMELLEPVFVSDHQFSVVGPTSLDEMVAAQSGQTTLHNGHWARASTAVSLALLQSAHRGSPVTPDHQVAPVA